MKIMKRILTTNVTSSGSLNTDAVTKALLLHRNTPAPDMGISPAELLFGRNINDHLPNPITFRKEWSELADLREKVHQKRIYASSMKNTTSNLKELPQFSRTRLETINVNGTAQESSLKFYLINNIAS